MMKQPRYYRNRLMKLNVPMRDYALGSNKLLKMSNNLLLKYNLFNYKNKLA